MDRRVRCLESSATTRNIHDIEMLSTRMLAHAELVRMHITSVHAHKKGPALEEISRCNSSNTTSVMVYSNLGLGEATHLRM